MKQLSGPKKALLVAGGILVAGFLANESCDAIQMHLIVSQTREKAKRQAKFFKRFAESYGENEFFKRGNMPPPNIKYAPCEAYQVEKGQHLSRLTKEPFDLDEWKMKKAWFEDCGLGYFELDWVQYQCGEIYVRCRREFCEGDFTCYPSSRSTF